ncbi:MAG TPA: M42 family metallopeptidase [Thermomicrobiales bacterium]|nr:M42 family metallopeptidase [Thermomicrobiales bacterium]
MTIDVDYIAQETVALCRIPSPTGYTQHASSHLQQQLRELGLKPIETVKGSIVVALPTSAAADVPGRMLSAHIDTLGAMVREIKPNGRLKLTLIGGYDWSTIEGEYCLVHRADGDPITGTILTTRASYHVHGAALVDLKRDADSIEVRIDELVNTAEDVQALGIAVGDFVSLDARTTETSSGYIKSRHLDDKACVAILLGVAKAIAEPLPVPAWLYFSVFEEVGHGTSAGIPVGVRDVIAVDMAAVGTGQSSEETAVTICTKDSSGPYHYGLTRELINLAKQEELDYRTDIYPFYGSDVSQALRAGYDIRGALVGPGVDASHSFERLHRDSLDQTARLLLAWLQST